jgi:hypothetical protein
MKVRFSGLKIESVLGLNYVCEGRRGYSNVFFNGQKPEYQAALGEQDIHMLTRNLDQ